MKLLVSLIVCLSIGTVFGQANVFFDLGVGTRLGTLRSAVDYTPNVAGIHFNGGVGYMANPVLGIKGDVGYDEFSTKYEGNTDPFSFTTKSAMLRFSLQGVLSISNWADFGGDKFSLNFHTGFGYSTMWNKDFKTKYPDFDDDRLAEKHDDMGNIIFGFTPMFNFNDELSLTLDLSYVALIGNDKGADFLLDKLEKINTGYTNVSLGLNFRIPAKKKSTTRLR